MRPSFVRRLATLATVSALAVVAVGGPLASTALGLTLTVTNLNDSGVGSLRQAIADASSGDTITFSVTGTITLATTLGIDKDLTIDGGGTITIDGNHAVRVISIAPVTVTLDGLTITNGMIFGGYGAGIENGGSLTVKNSTISGNQDNAAFGEAGGGISNGGTLVVNNSTISGNSANYFGGGIFNSGTLTVTKTAITGNTAGLGSGGIYNTSAGTITNTTISANSAGIGAGIGNEGSLTIRDTTIVGNSATDSAGGIFNSGTITVTGSTITGNAAGADGGGIVNSNFATVANSTLFGNHAMHAGGGIELPGSGAINLDNVTITANSAADGGGIHADGTAQMRNTIDAGNTAPVGSDYGGGSPPVLADHALVGIPSGKTLAEILVVDGGGVPVLAANGGPTKTVALALVAGNPAIDTGSSATCAASPVSGKDQRGKTRPTACDIGAYEAQPPTVAAHADVTASPTSGSGGPVTYTAPAGTDEQGGALTTTCLPASGSTFPMGSTSVTCTATDAVGHTGTGTFQVVLGAFVTAAPTVRPTLCECDTSTLAADRSETPGLPLVLAVLGVLAAIALRPIGVRARRKE